jgi:hypothetical protein
MKEFVGAQMKKITTLAMALLLSACSSQVRLNHENGQLTIVNTLDRAMYLRGDFTLWDAEPHYLLKETQPGVYTVKAKFMTPGKVYEFKLADADWSQGYNCGYKVQGSLTLNKPTLADCNTVYNYFSFMPDKKGWYTITFNYTDGSAPTVMVSRS